MAGCRWDEDQVRQEMSLVDLIKDPEGWIVKQEMGQVN